jgi:hypothetical protein
MYFTRERLGLVVDPSLTGLRVLDRIAEARVYPARMVSDNGTELTSNPGRCCDRGLPAPVCRRTSRAP